jgi:prepilin signal peptidase PulO-like enzyme (type II secretory pathway)
MSQAPHIYPPPIEPDSDGRYRPPPRVWLHVVIVQTGIWAGYLYFNTPDWWSVGVGFSTGMMLALWAIDMTGNKLPDFMKPTSVRRRKPRD